MQTTTTTAETVPAPVDATVTADVAAEPVRLAIPRGLAGRELQAALKIGTAIRNQRIRDQRELDEARREKLEWTARSTDLLARLFASEAVGEQWNRWTPPILPEYAEFALFRDLFDQEMKLRLGRLQSVIAHLDDIPESADVTGADAATGDGTVQGEPFVAVTEQAVPPATVPVVASSTVVSSNGAGQAVPTRPVTVVKRVEPRVVLEDAPHVPPAHDDPAATILILRLADAATPDPLPAFFAKLRLPTVDVDPRGPGAPSLSAALDRHRGVAYAVVLVRPDALAGGYLFDLGCCVGRLGESRVCSVSPGGIAPDNRGLPHVSLEPGDGWQLQLARELRRGGVEVDVNKLC